MHKHLLDVCLKRLCIHNPELELPAGHYFKERSLYMNCEVYHDHDEITCIGIKSLHVTLCILKPCLYYAFYKGKRVYVTIVACANHGYMHEIRRIFCKIFDMGELRFSLTVRVTRTKKFIELDQLVHAY